MVYREHKDEDWSYYKYESDDNDFNLMMWSELETYNEIKISRHQKLVLIAFFEPINLIEKS